MSFWLERASEVALHLFVGDALLAPLRTDFITAVADGLDQAGLVLFALFVEILSLAVVSLAVRLVALATVGIDVILETVLGVRQLFARAVTQLLLLADRFFAEAAVFALQGPDPVGILAVVILAEAQLRFFIAIGLRGQGFVEALALALDAVAVIFAQLAFVLLTGLALGADRVHQIGAGGVRDLQILDPLFAALLVDVLPVVAEVLLRLGDLAAERFAQRLELAVVALVQAVAQTIDRGRLRVLLFAPAGGVRVGQAPALGVEVIVQAFEALFIVLVALVNVGGNGLPQIFVPTLALVGDRLQLLAVDVADVLDVLLVFLIARGERLGRVLLGVLHLLGVLPLDALDFVFVALVQTSVLDVVAFDQVALALPEFFPRPAEHVLIATAIGRVRITD